MPFFPCSIYSPILLYCFSWIQFPSLKREINKPDTQKTLSCFFPPPKSKTPQKTPLQPNLNTGSQPERPSLALCVNAVWGLAVHTPRVQATDAQFDFWRNHSKFCTVNILYGISALCYFCYLTGLVPWDCYFLHTVFSHFNRLPTQMLVLPSSLIKIESVLHEY